ncbi:MAG: hypothetical protein ACK4QL_07530 [Pseudanabaenaceae cyanobacterium]
MSTQLDREIDQIKNSLCEYEQKMAVVYKHYCEAIAGALARQLIQASFQLCTRHYPQAFLTLSLEQRYQFQQALQQLAKSAQQEAIAQLSTLGPQAVIADQALDQALGQLLQQTSGRANQLLTEYQILPTDKSEAVIQLRAVEVEYTDRQVLNYRSEMRVIAGRYQQLQQELAHKLHQKQIIDAELAWRSTWSEI